MKDDDALIYLPWRNCRTAGYTVEPRLFEVMWGGGS